MSKKSSRSINVTPAPSLDDLQRFAEDTAGELETIRARVGMIQAALVLESTPVTCDAARLLTLDVDNPLQEYIERARALSGTREAAAATE